MLWVAEWFVCDCWMDLRRGVEEELWCAIVPLDMPPTCVCMLADWLRNLRGRLRGGHDFH